MRYTEVIIIGGGQAGLAMSRCLTERGIEHLVLERGNIGQRWKHERWDSLRLLTPNWQTRLPGLGDASRDPDGFMAASDFARLLDDYAASFSAPVETDAEVLRVTRRDELYQVTTRRGAFLAPALVLATGDCDVPAVPRARWDVSGWVSHVVPSRYRNPAQLPDAGVLVVGASATGIQLAEEIHRSGRPVTLAVGRHTRLPRRYRGKDILWWLDTMGVFEERADEVPDLEASRCQPSLQLVGRDDGRTLDLAELSRIGVRLVGRLGGARGDRVRFANDLGRTTAAADAKLDRLRRRIDRFAAEVAIDVEVGTPDPLPPFVPAEAPTEIDLRSAGIGTIVWATGFRRDYAWLDVPVLDAHGELIHDGGVTPSPGLYALGLRFMRRRNSSFIGGVGRDARELARHVAAYLGAPESAAA